MKLDFRNFLVKLFFGREWLSIRRVHNSLKEERNNLIAEANTLKGIIIELNARMENIVSMVHQINHNQKIEEFWDRLKRSTLDEKYFEDWAKQMKEVDNIIDETKGGKENERSRNRTKD